VKKRASPELGVDKPVESINRFIETELERLESMAPPAEQRGAVIPELNALLLRSVRAAWA